MTFVPFQKLCRGKCKGERGAIDSPAVWGKRGEDKVLWCPCCDAALLRTEYDMSTGAPNVKKEVSAQQVRFEDINCGYDVVVLVSLS